MPRKKSDAEWLKAARAELRMSQTDLAEILGMTQGNITWYESGRTKKLPKLVREKVEELLVTHKLAS